MTLTNTRRAGVFAIGLTLAALLVANLVGGGPEENGGVVPLIVTFAICACLAAWMFWRLVPRAVEAGPATSGTRALVIAVLSAITLPVFWSGLPYVLAPAGLALGVASRARGGGAKATVAIAIAAVALVAAIAGLVGDQLAN